MCKFFENFWFFEKVQKVGFFGVFAKIAFSKSFFTNF